MFLTNLFSRYNLNISFSYILLLPRTFLYLIFLWTLKTGILCFPKCDIKGLLKFYEGIRGVFQNKEQLLRSVVRDKGNMFPTKLFPSQSENIRSFDIFLDPLKYYTIFPQRALSQENTAIQILLLLHLIIEHSYYEVQ